MPRGWKLAEPEEALREKILSRMKRTGTSQKELAEALGMNPATICRRLKDPGRLTYSEYLKIDRYLRGKET